jgi:tRNA threonylcarbamoyladenosine biosynthesis protein TsaB
VLGLDCAWTAGAAVIDGDTLLAACVAGEGARPAAQLVPLAARALGEAGLGLADIDGIAVGTGPGSYAGVRTAVATAKAWAWAGGRPLVGVDSLGALALAAGPFPGPVWAVLDARNGHLFAGCFRDSGAGDLRTLVPAAFLDAPLLGQRLAAAEDAVLVAGAAGPWAGAVPTRPQALGGMAAGVARLGARALAAGAAQDPLTLVPRYLREPQLGRPRPAVERNPAGT